MVIMMVKAQKKLALNARTPKICKVLKKKKPSSHHMYKVQHIPFSFLFLSIIIISPSLPFPSPFKNLVLNRLSRVDSKTLGGEDDVELELAGGGAAGTLVLAGRGVVLDGVKVDNEVVLDGEDGVGREPGVVLGVDLGDDGLVVFVGDLEIAS